MKLPIWPLRYFQNDTLEVYNQVKMLKIKLVIVIVSSFLLAGCVPQLGSSGKPVGKEEFVAGQVIGGFPGVPLYSGAKVIESYGYKGSYGASFITEDDFSQVVKFYNETLPQLGWEAALGEISSSNFVFEIKNAAVSGSVIVNTAADNKRTAITISVTGR